jgi:hypothetical protein
MAGQPHHPDTGDDTGARREPLTARQRWARLAVILLVTALFVAIIVLHLTGVVGPGTNG